VHLSDISKDYDAAVADLDRALGRGSQIRGHQKVFTCLNTQDSL